MAQPSTLQQQIDAITYPPTHQYQLDGLVPKGDLKKRLDIIEAEFPGFFKGNLLDVGCNKGFFSLYHDGKVTGIDPIAECVDLCRRLKPEATFAWTTFGDFRTYDTFDRIFIGNGPHYPFIEARGWGWVKKLAHLSVGKVLLEGPIDMTGRDAKNCIPAELWNHYNLESMKAAFEPWFFWRKQVHSPLVDRWFTLLEKKDELVHASMDRYADYLRAVYAEIAEMTTTEDVVMEICTRHDRGVLSRGIIPHKAFILVDRSPKRPGLNLDALEDVLPDCDVTISTAILHHTPPEDIRSLIGNIARTTRRLMVFTGPSADMIPELFGDHLYHLGEMPEIEGWRIIKEKSAGLSEPKCEKMVVYQKSAS